MIRPDSIDEYTLLCERCGYVIEGLSDTGACPECGQPIRTAHPSSRTGSPWQRHRSAKTWLATNWQTLRHPRTTFATLRIDAAGDRLLREVNLQVAATLPTIAVVIIGFAAAADGANQLGVLAVQVFTLLLFASPIGVLLYLVLRTSVWIEAQGLRFFGARRGWRVSIDVASSICCHASVGWICGSLLLFIAALPVTAMLVLNQSGRDFRAAGQLMLVMLGLVVASALLGLLAFETLAYIGMRQCKFANRPRPQHPSPPP